MVVAQPKVLIEILKVYILFINVFDILKKKVEY